MLRKDSGSFRNWVPAAAPFLLALCLASPAAGQPTATYCAVDGLTLGGFDDCFGFPGTGVCSGYDIDGDGAVAFADFLIFLGECNGYMKISGEGNGTDSATVTIDDRFPSSSLYLTCGPVTRTLTSFDGKTPDEYRDELKAEFDTSCFSITALSDPGSFKVANVPKEVLSFKIGVCEVIGNPSGCAFNPIFVDLDEQTSAVPALSTPGLIAVWLLLAAAASFAIRRARRGSPASGPGPG